MLIKYIFSIFLYTPYVCIICSTSHYSELSNEYFHITICFMDPSKFLYVCPFYLICPTYSISPFMYILFDISFYVYIRYLYICPTYSISSSLHYLLDISFYMYHLFGIFFFSYLFDIYFFGLSIRCFSDISFDLLQYLSDIPFCRRCLTI